MHEFGQVLGHPLGQRGDQRAVALWPRSLRHSSTQVVDLVLDRLDLDRRVDEAGRADHLLAEHAAGLLHLPRRPASPRRSTVCGRIASHSLKRSGRLSMQLGRRKPYSASVILRRWSPLRHRADLRHGLVALVDEQRAHSRADIRTGRRRLARQAPGQEAGVILDARAGAGRRDHLQVEAGALLQPLAPPAACPRPRSSLSRSVELMPDRFHRLLERRARASRSGCSG